MKIQHTDKANIQLNSEYPNIIMIVGKSLIITLKYKNKSIQDSYSNNNLLMDIQYIKM